MIIVQHQVRFDKLHWASRDNDKLPCTNKTGFGFDFAALDRSGYCDSAGILRSFLSQNGMTHLS